MNEAWAIKDWDRVFERHDTRRYDELKYVCKPVGRKSVGYLRLASTEQGIIALGVFDGLVTAAAHARCHEWRGILGDEAGEWTIPILASMTSMNEQVIGRSKSLQARGLGGLCGCHANHGAHPAHGRRALSAHLQTHLAHTLKHTWRTPPNTPSARQAHSQRRRR